MASQQMSQQQPQYAPSPSSPPTLDNPLFSPSLFTNLSLPLYSTPLHGLASFMGPKYFQTSHKANLPSPPLSPPMMSKTLSMVLSGKQSILSQGGLGRKSPPPMKEQEQALVTALAGQTLVKCLCGMFWDAFSGSESSSLRKIDVDKVRRVLEGKAVVQIVHVHVETQKEMPVVRKVSNNCRDACSVTAILEESMKSLTSGKKSSLFLVCWCTHICSLVIEMIHPSSQHSIASFSLSLSFRIYLVSTCLRRNLFT